MAIKIFCKHTGELLKHIDSTSPKASAPYGKEVLCKESYSSVMTPKHYGLNEIGIDRMVILLNTEDQVVKKHIYNQLVYEGYKNGFIEAKKQKGKEYIYQQAFRSLLCDEVFIKLNPIHPSMAYLSIQINPQKMGTSGINAFKAQLDKILLGGYEYLKAHGHIKYIETCYDVAINHNDYLLHVKGVQTKPEYTNCTVKKPTEYFGQKEASASFKVYDKHKMLRRSKYGEPEDKQITRIEVRHVCSNGKKKRMLHELPFLPNQFPRVYCFEIKSIVISEKDDQFMADFLSAAVNLNFFYAMKLLPNHYWRQKVLGVLEHSSPYWWKPKEIWSTQWKKLIKAYGL